ncbi:Mitochondrial import inner membrane translocase subunit TIM17-2 [Vitis vinifera]|uniref:Mitochondrial import inner membrane translocase subunit TIM17-2 n=1 Tax=Vitis vinifera TaxID=29760 RepID=A0A438DS55_VITVI|nr:Mitochondrial import inner membrane translocase subunit TIM17-2 [Vitis vinifera]
MGTPETSREPCPDRILDDVGGAFGMGAVGGSAFHFLKGIYNSPKGERVIGGSQAVRMNAPRKEDPWNSIIAGAATGGFLQMRQGLAASTRSAIFGGVLLGLIEGAGIMLNKVLSAPQNLPMTMEEPVPGMTPGPVSGYPMGQLPGMTPPAPPAPEPSSGSSSWFGGLFGGGKKQEPAANSGSKTEILESFDTPTPMPSFEYK